MKLSISMIARDLPYVTLEKGSGKLLYDRCEVLCAGGDLKPDVLYLTHSGAIPKGVRAKEGCGAVCIGRLPTSALPGVEILTVDEEIDILTLVNTVNAIFYKYNAIELKLHEAVNGREDVRKIVELSAPMFDGNELIVVDSDFYILAQSGKELHTLKISGIAQPPDSMMPEEVVTYLKSERYYTEIRNIHKPFLYEPGILSCRIIGVNVFYHNDFACRAILGEDCKPFQPHDIELMEFITGFIQQIYDTAVADMRLLPKNRLAELLTILIDDGKIDSYELEEELTRRDWIGTDPYICLCIQADTLAMMNKTQPYFCNLINKQWENVCAYQHKSWIACLVNLKEYGAQSESFFAEKVESFRDMCFRVGISDVFCEITDLYYSYRQSEIALRTGIKKSPLGWRYSFADYSLDYVFTQITQELDARHVASWRLRILIDHDRQNKTEYCRTLYSYINSGMNAMQSARDLYIHRTTMVYRLNRIKEMAGLDIGDSRELLYMHLSMVLLWDEMKRLKVI